MPLKGRWEPSVNAVPTELLSLRDMFCPRRGVVGSVGNAVSTELLSLRDKVSAWWRPSTGLVSLRDIPPRCTVCVNPHRSRIAPSGAKAR